VTAHAQPGNRQPRLFRMPHSRAIINRMGFNNSGVEALAARLDQWDVRRGNNALDYPVGVSIGKTKATPLEDAVDDYLHSLRTIAPYADYVAINVSSPNTPGLRSLQDREALTQLTTALVSTAPNSIRPIRCRSSSSWRPIWHRTMWAGSSPPVRTPDLRTDRHQHHHRARVLHPSELHLANQAGDCPVLR
jgi:dihydroorotate dehydrogenase